MPRQRTTSGCKMGRVHVLCANGKVGRILEGRRGVYVKVL